MAPDDDLSLELREAIASLLERANVCRLVCLADLDDALPARRLGRSEADRLLARLAAAGLHVVEPDAAERLTKTP